MRTRSLSTVSFCSALLLMAAARAHAHAGDLERPLPELSEYFLLGVEHILLGFDHLVFLAGVVLLATRTREVLAAVTAFTLAHSITLALSVLGFVSVSPRLVEPLIALSVAYVGVENFWLRDGAQRYRLTFAFGLVHGFGFAGALSEIGVPGDRAAAALVLFNLGVEAGQLLVLVCLWPLLRWFRQTRERPFLRLARFVNVALVALGLGWAFERTVGGETAEATEGGGDAVLGSSVPSQPVYPRVAALPLAERLCRALQRVPRERRAACGGGPVGITLEAECTRMLSGALASGALRVDDSSAAACVAAVERRYEGCEFARAVHLPPLAECQVLWRGELAVGAQCRSSLECESGLHCRGLGPAEPGLCSAPQPAGAACGQSIDALAAYLPDRSADHPECVGRCGGQRCVDELPMRP